MSLNTLARQATVRALGPLDGLPPQSGPGGVQPAAPGQAGVGPAPARSSFEVFTRYIPTETVTIFVAALSIRPNIEAALPLKLQPYATVATVYWICAFLTPILQLALTYLNRRDAGDPAPLKALTQNPWPVIAAFIAFLIWALSVPGVLDRKSSLVAIAGFGALFVSMLLSLGDRFARV